MSRVLHTFLRMEDVILKFKKTRTTFESVCFFFKIFYIFFFFLILLIFFLFFSIGSFLRFVDICFAFCFRGRGVVKYLFWNAFRFDLKKKNIVAKVLYLYCWMNVILVQNFRKISICLVSLFAHFVIHKKPL